MGVGLEGGNKAVDAKRQDAGADEQQAAVLADALPDQPGAADLGQRGQAEQQDRPQHRHAITLSRGVAGLAVGESILDPHGPSRQPRAAKGAHSAGGRPPSWHRRPARPPAGAFGVVALQSWSPLAPPGPVISSTGSGEPSPQEQSVSESHSAATAASST